MPTSVLPGQHDLLGAAVHHGEAGDAAGLDNLRPREHHRAAGEPVDVLHSTRNARPGIGAAGTDGFLELAAAMVTGASKAPGKREQPAAADDGAARGAAGIDCDPAKMVSLVAVPPDDMISMPPEMLARLSWPRLPTLPVPPERIVVKLATLPTFASICWGSATAERWCRSP